MIEVFIIQEGGKERTMLGERPKRQIHRGKNNHSAEQYGLQKEAGQKNARLAGLGQQEVEGWQRNGKGMCLPTRRSCANISWGGAALTMFYRIKEQVECFFV